MDQPKLKTTIAVIGCGDVGATLAYTLILQSICTEVLLVDPKASLLDGQVRDLSDATSRSTKVRAGTHQEAGQADIVVITAGAKQKMGESRLSLLTRNLNILNSIFDSMKPMSQHTVLLLVANPVDILCYFAREMSGLPENQVLGTGTSLDSARLRGILAQKAGVSPSSIDAYALGEHGDSQFVSCLLSGLTSALTSIKVAWSSASIGTTSLRLALGDELTEEFKEEVATKTRGAAGAIIAAKGCTSYGIGNVAASICRHILFDSRTVRPLSFYQPKLNCCLSMPAVLGRRGIVKAMPIELDASETKELETCARGLRAVIEGAKKELSADKELAKALEMDKGS